MKKHLFLLGILTILMVNTSKASFYAHYYNQTISTDETIYYYDSYNGSSVTTIIHVCADAYVTSTDEACLESGSLFEGASQHYPITAKTSAGNNPATGYGAPGPFTFSVASMTFHFTSWKLGRYGYNGVGSATIYW